MNDRIDRLRKIVGHVRTVRATLIKHPAVYTFPAEITALENAERLLVGLIAEELKEEPMNRAERLRETLRRIEASIRYSQTVARELAEAIEEEEKIMTDVEAAADTQVVEFGKIENSSIHHPTQEERDAEAEWRKSNEKPDKQKKEPKVCPFFRMARIMAHGHAQLLEGPTKPSDFCVRERCEWWLSALIGPGSCALPAIATGLDVLGAVSPSPKEKQLGPRP